jgi:hypothetical protein
VLAVAEPAPAGPSSAPDEFEQLTAVGQ